MSNENLETKVTTDKNRKKKTRPDLQDTSTGPQEIYPMLHHCYGERVKREFEDMITIIAKSNIYKRMGTKPPKSFKFVGEPGTGKSMGPHVIANQLSFDLYPQEVKLLEYATGTHGTAMINMSSKKLQEFFDEGRKELEENPRLVHSVIYFLDEADSLMGKRHEGKSNAGKEDDKLLNTLMKNMQRINDDGTNEYIILTTNHEKAMDEAAVRSGRIDRRVYFYLPDYDDRVDAVAGFIDECNQNATHKVVRNCRPENVAEVTENFNYADLKNVVESAVQERITKGLRQRSLRDNTIPRWYVQEKDLIRTAGELAEQKGYSQQSRIGF